MAIPLEEFNIRLHQEKEKKADTDILEPEFKKRQDFFSLLYICAASEKGNSTVYDRLTAFRRSTSRFQERYSNDYVEKLLNEYIFYQKPNTQTFLLIASACEFDSKECKFTIIHWLTYLGKLNLLWFFLDNYHIDLEMKVNFYNGKKLIRDVTPLWIAAFKKNHALMRLLLEYDADPNTYNGSSGATPLRMVTSDGTLSLMKLLIEHNASVNQANHFRSTPLMLASNENQKKAVRILLKNGANPNLSAYCGNTPLHYAAQNGYLDIINQLLNYGARFQTNVSGLTPLFLAALYHQKKVVDLFLNLPNFVSLQDRITTYEILAAGLCVSKKYEETPIVKIYKYLRISLILRYSSLSLDSLKSHKIRSVKFDPKKLPRHPRDEIIQDIKKFNIFKTINDLEMIKTDTKALLYECLLILYKLYGPNSLKFAEALIMIGARIIDQYNYDWEGFHLWIRAIKIKIQIKVFIAKDLMRFVDALYQSTINESFVDQYDYLKRYCEIWVSVVNLAIEYFDARPLPSGLQALSFQLNAHQLSEIEHFTHNEIKIGNLIVHMDNYYDQNEQDDIDNVIDSIIAIIVILTKHFPSLKDSEKDLVQNAIGKVARLNFTNSTCGRHLMHLVFINRKVRNLVGICSLLKMLYYCGVNTNVFDTAYNSPLHYLAYYCSKRYESTRRLLVLFRDLNDHFYHGTYIDKPLYHFDYADQNRIHLDAVNCFNQTAYDLNPSLALCNESFKNLKLFPLKCLAARVAHCQWLRCEMCKSSPAKVYEDGRRRKCWFTQRNIGSFPFNFDKFYKEINTMFRDNHGNPSYMYLLKSIDYSLKRKYQSHLPEDYDAKKVWPFVHQSSQSLGISVKLLEFIEMHGPCKFVHLVRQNQWKK